MARQRIRIVTPEQGREFFTPCPIVRLHRQIGEQRSCLSGSDQNRNGATRVRFDRERVVRAIRLALFDQLDVRRIVLVARPRLVVRELKRDQLGTAVGELRHEVRRLDLRDRLRGRRNRRNGGNDGWRFNGRWRRARRRAYGRRL